MPEFQDPLSHDLEALWRGTASRNAAAFSRVFNCVPAAGIQTWQQYKGAISGFLRHNAVLMVDRFSCAGLDYVPKKPIKVGHVARADMPVQYIKVLSITASLLAVPGDTGLIFSSIPPGTTGPDPWSPCAHAARFPQQRSVSSLSLCRASQFFSFSV